MDSTYCHVDAESFIPSANLALLLAICHSLKVLSDGLRETAHLLFSTVSCLSSLVSSQLTVLCDAFFGAERA